MPVRPPNGRNVKSDSAPAANGTADEHERAKDLLSDGELTALLNAAKAGRRGARDHLLLLVMFRHGLRVSEAVAIRRDEVDLDRGRLLVRRLKGGLSVEQPIAGDELRAFRRYFAERDDGLPWLFISERGHPLTRQSVNYLVGAAVDRAGLAPGPSQHASPFVWIRARQQRLRPTTSSGLPRPSRPKAYRSLHSHSGVPLRGTVAMRASSGHDRS